MKKKWIGLLLLVAAFFVYKNWFMEDQSGANLPASKDYTPVTSRYSYGMLREDSARELYEEILKNAYRTPSSSEDGVYLTKNVSTKDKVDDTQLFLAAHAFKADHPEVFWLSVGAMRAFGVGEIASIYLASDYTPDQLALMKDKFNAAVQSFLSGVPAGLSQEELERYTHDYLLKTCEYDFDALDENGESDKNDVNYKEVHSAYGALVDHKAVCSGYARAYQLLLNRLGIDCVPIYGKGSPLESEPFGVRIGRSDHEWNAVKNGGVWLMTDVTWDDVDDPAETTHYFNLPISEMYRDHQARQIDLDSFVYSPIFTAHAYSDCLFLPR